MIKVRLQSFSNKTTGDVYFPITDGESITSAADRILAPAKLSHPSNKVFKAVINGHAIDGELWSHTSLKSNDDVVLYPAIRDAEDPGSVFRLVLVAVAVAYGQTWAAGYYGAGTTGAILATAGITVAATFAAHSLFPPPVPGGMDNLGAGPGLSGSQMYSVNGQSNSVKRYGFVPRVYGTHKVYPNVAANPYTELATDPVSKELVQYLYSIYDFGFGPLDVTNIKIGDTPLSEYSDVQYNLVDLNRPDVSEGPWDDVLNKKFSLYKGDVNLEGLSLVIDGNTEDGSPLSECEVVRNCAPNPDLLDQEISIQLYNPQGLIAYDSKGGTHNRNIELQVYFSKVGENVWKPYNDTQWVTSYQAVGGSDIYNEVMEEFYLPTTISGGPIVDLTLSDYIYCGPQQALSNFGIASWSNNNYRIKSRGYDKGTTVIHLKNHDLLVPGTALKVSGSEIGKILSVANYVGDFKAVTLDKPLTKPLVVTEWATDGITDVEIDSSKYKNTVYRSVLSLGKALISRQDNNPVYSTVRFTPAEPGEYKVRITRVKSYSTFAASVRDSLAVTGLTTRFDTEPIVTDKRHVFLELRIKATNQLNGTIQNLSAECSSILDVHNGVSWVKQKTSNPAWIFADILTGSVNKRAISKDRLHIPSLIEWATFCDQIPTPPMGYTYVSPRFTCNFVLDYQATVQSLLDQVSGSAQASLNLIDGKYGVLIDKLKTVPVQVFTPRNSRNFSSMKNFPARPHAIKVKFINPQSDWEVDERIVYDTGYDATTATEFEELQSFGVTSPDQAWRYGRFMLAHNRLRRETINLEVDFEHLVCSRGDYVKITQDVMKVGGTPARVKSVSGNQIVIDDAIDTGPYSYGYTFRSPNGIYTSTLSIVSADTFNLNGTIPQVGDLIIIGVVGNITYDCIVKSIAPSDDLTAQLVLMEKADGIYSAESSDTIEEYDPQLSPTVNPDFAPPGEVGSLTVTDNFWYCNGERYEYYIELDWEVPQGAAYEYFEIYVDYGRGYDMADFTRESIYRYIVDSDNLGKPHNFKVLAVSASGNKLDLGAVGFVTATPVLKTTAPSSIGRLNIDITGEVLQLFWDKIADCDVREYVIRYSPIVVGATWQETTPLLTVDKNTSLISTQGRTGSYLIKARDFNGNESDEAAYAITTIPELFGLNVIDSINDFPGLTGIKDTVEIDDSSIKLKKAVIGDPLTTEYYPEGYYYYDDILDMGEIYTVRLQNLVRAKGFTLSDLMVNWVPLSSVTALSSVGGSQWDVETQYRTRDSLANIASWNPLSDVDFLSAGDVNDWTSWKKLASVGDATGRLIQFRLKLISNIQSVTPQVIDGLIKADMPDRIESYNNIAAPNTGYSIAYSPEFKGPGTSPNIQISIDGAASGDYWVISNRTLSGFDIQFFDKNNIAVARTFDAVVKGYGRKATASL